MTNEIQQPIEIQNPTSTLQNEKKKNNLLVFLAMAVVAFFLVAYFAKNLLSKSSDNEPKDKNQTTAASNTGNDPFANLDNLRYRPETVIQEDGNPAPIQTTQNAIVQQPPANDVIKAASAVVLRGSGNNNASMQRDLRFPENQTNDPVQQAQMNALLANGGLSGQGQAKNAKQNDYESLNYATAKAAVSTLNPSLSIAKGTFIRCSLRTKLVTTVGGEVACTITNDIYSTDGKVMLVEKGSQVLGHFKSGGQMNLGDARVFVIWNEIRTPHNIRIQIDSNATGSLGETGIGGWVDTHFWDRFGSAILISLITDTTGALTSHLADSDKSGYDFKDTTDSSREVVESILKETVNIPPTLYRNQGDIVGIMVARDVDFSGVYSLRFKGNR